MRSLFHQLVLEALKRARWSQQPKHRQRSAFTATGRLTLGLFAALAVVLGACTPRSEIRSAEPLSEIQPPHFELLDGQTRIERFNPPGAGGTAELVIAARVTNPNTFAVRVERIEYTVSLEGRKVAQGRLDPELFLEAGEVNTLRFSVEAELRSRPDLLRAVARAFAETPLAFRVSGRVNFSSPSYAFRTRPFTLLEGETLAREAVVEPLLRLNERESEVFLLQPDVPVVRVVVEVTNPGDIGYFLFGKDLHLRLAGESLAVEDLTPAPIPAGQSSRIDILFYPATSLLGDRALLALDAAMQGLPTSVEVDGDLFMDVLGVDTFAVPPSWEVFGFVDVDRIQVDGP